MPQYNKHFTQSWVALTLSAFQFMVAPRYSARGFENLPCARARSLIVVAHYNF